MANYDRANAIVDRKKGERNETKRNAHTTDNMLVPLKLKLWQILDTFAICAACTFVCRHQRTAHSSLPFDYAENSEMLIFRSVVTFRI